MGMVDGIGAAGVTAVAGVAVAAGVVAASCSWPFASTVTGVTLPCPSMIPTGCLEAVSSTRLIPDAESGITVNSPTW